MAGAGRRRRALPARRHLPSLAALAQKPRSPRLRRPWTSCRGRKPAFAAILSTGSHRRSSGLRPRLRRLLTKRTQHLRQLLRLDEIGCFRGRYPLAFALILLRPGFEDTLDLK